MLICPWEELPPEMQIEEVRPYWELLRKKKGSLAIKRAFDVAASSVLLLLFSPAFLALAVAIKADSEGPVFYRQERVTQYGKHFFIHKFRSMINNADKKGTLVTVSNDRRVTRVGRFIRKYKFDEISQLIDVFMGDMSFVGTRPEVPQYVACYLPEMYATLLLPAGITSVASIVFKDENSILDTAEDVEKVYIGTILPEKMKYNLKSIKEFSLMNEVFTIVKTIIAII